MTDKEIIKAITACGIDMNCSRYPYNDNEPLDTSCFSKLFKDTFDLINRQKAEVESLKEKNESLDTLVLSYGDYVTKARAEAIEEFAERLKTKKFKYRTFGELVYVLGEFIYVDEIDNLVKEMVGEEQCTNQK